jgi:hypothetical protein
MYISADRDEMRNLALLMLLANQRDNSGGFGGPLDGRAVHVVHERPAVPDDDCGNCCNYTLGILSTVAKVILVVSLIFILWPVALTVFVGLAVVSCVGDEDVLGFALEALANWIVEDIPDCDGGCTCVCSEEPGVRVDFGEDAVFVPAVIDTNDLRAKEIEDADRDEATVTARERFKAFNLRPDQVEMNVAKIYPFDELLANFKEPAIASVQNHLRDWDGGDFTHGDAAANRTSLLENWRFRAISSGHGSSGKVHEYLTILFNILHAYRGIVENDPRQLEKYRETVARTIAAVYATFDSGCDFNQLSSLRSTITDLMGAHPSLAVRTGMSPQDFQFALALSKYQLAELRKAIGPADREQVETEFTMMKHLGLSQDAFGAHFNLTEQRKQQIERRYTSQYHPENYFLVRLMQRPENVEAVENAAIGGSGMREFQAAICQWFAERDLAVDENYDLLQHKDAGQYDYWLNHKAVLYYMVENGFFKAAKA